MTPRALAEGLLHRELGTRRILGLCVAAAVAGMICGYVAAALPDDSRGSATILLRFDRTLAAITAIGAAFLCIERLATDARSDWMLQLVAAGAPRDLYAIVLSVTVALAMGLFYIAGALAFCLALAVLSHDASAIGQVAIAAPLCLLMILSGSTYGLAMGSLIRQPVAAARVVVALVAAPWVVIWLNAILHDTPVQGTGILRALDYASPRLFVAWTIANVSYVVMFIGITIGIAMLLADRRIGRRE